jgi:hypothetical protein
MDIIRIGSANQNLDGGSTTFSASTTGAAAAGVPPISLDWLGKNQSSSFEIIIDDIEGAIRFQSVLSDNQGVNIPESLGKLYTPGNPLSSTLQDKN